MGRADSVARLGLTVAWNTPAGVSKKKYSWGIARTAIIMSYLTDYHYHRDFIGSAQTGFLMRSLSWFNIGRTSALERGTGGDR